MVGGTLHNKTLWLLEDFNQTAEMKQREREESGDDFELRTRHQTNAMQQLPHNTGKMRGNPPSN